MESLPKYSCGHEPTLVKRESNLLQAEIWLCNDCKNEECYQGTDIE